MGVKQDAWTTQVNLFDSGVGNYIIARDNMLNSYSEFNIYLNNFLVDSGITQESWDEQILNMRQATITKNPRFEGGLLVRPGETQDSFTSTWFVCENALIALQDLAGIYGSDDTIPNNIRNQIGRIDFDPNDNYITFSPSGVIYTVLGSDGITRVHILKPPNYWLIANQFGTFIINGRTESIVSDDPDNTKTKLGGVSFIITVDDSLVFTVMDDTRDITGID